MSKTPGDIARELGLKFSEEKLGEKWVKFRFEFPDYDKIEVDTKTVTFNGVPKDFKAPETFLATVEAVKRWRERVKPWMLLGASDSVASELTLWTRATVFKFNRANKKLIKAANEKLQKSEAYARQLAMTQSTPMQAIKILDELTKCAEPETQALKMQLQNAVALAEARIAEAKAHADETCSCAKGELCPVGVATRDLAAEKALAEVIPLKRASA